jgi:hypothetical protein
MRIFEDFCAFFSCLLCFFWQNRRRKSKNNQKTITMLYVCYQQSFNMNEITSKGGIIVRAGTIWIDYWSPNGEPLTNDSYLP